MPAKPASTPPWNPMRRLLAHPPRPRAGGSRGAGGAGSARRCATVELVPDRRQPASSPRPDALHARGHPLARLRAASRSARARSRALERVAAGRAGGRGRPGPESRREPDAARAGGIGTRGGSARPIGSRCARVGRVARVRAHLVWSPETRVPYRDSGRHDHPADRPSRFLGRRRVDPPRACRSFADQVRFSIVHHTAGRNDYSRAEAAAIVKGDPALPRAGERLERHRLQLPRRPLRHDLRGPVRRRRAQRRRRARARVQHRFGRNRAARDVREHGSFAAPRRRRSPSCSPGASTSPTSIRLRR